MVEKSLLAAAAATRAPVDRGFPCLTLLQKQNRSRAPHLLTSLIPAFAHPRLQTDVTGFKPWVTKSMYGFLSTLRENHVLGIGGVYLEQQPPNRS